MPERVVHSDRIHLMFNGLGAGNIGDEAAFKGFLHSFPLSPGSSVEVYDLSNPIMSTFPSWLKYVTWTNDDANHQLAQAAKAVLLVGDTPVMSEWGLDWPMRALSKRLAFCQRLQIPVHAVGVGVDFLYDEEARKIFLDNFFHIASWTVRSAHCRAALLDLGVEPEKIAVGADLAWLFEADPKDFVWARGFWKDQGIDLSRPLIGVNVVNERWEGRNEVKHVIAMTLDQIIGETGIQVAFLCNETRSGSYFDYDAAKEVMRMMRKKAYLVPNHYFTPSQMLALLSHCAVVLSQRYHFTVLSVLAGAACLSFARGQKMSSLLDEFGEAPVGTMDSCDADVFKKRLVATLQNTRRVVQRQQQIARYLAIRAKNNFQFVNPAKPKIRPMARLASVFELESPGFKNFMEMLNAFSARWGFRQFTDWSKVWEYPWLWFHGLESVDWPRVKVLDLGSELSPMPWFLASLGAHVTIVERDAQWVRIWKRIAKETWSSVEWQIVEDERLHFPEHHFDIVTSFSVIEHQKDKWMAISEVAKVLKPGGIFAVSFDICEPNMGMTFPEWNGKALTMEEFEMLIWKHPQFDNDGQEIKWNIEDCAEFIKWHLQSAPHHNYVVGAAILPKKG